LKLTSRSFPSKLFRAFVFSIAASLLLAAFSSAQGSTQLVSVNRFGTGCSNCYTYAPKISSDGRFVAFATSAKDLVERDTNNTFDVFVRDLQTGTTSLVSVNRLGTDSANGYSYDLQISPNGRFVAFVSNANDLADNDANSNWDVYVRDMQAGTTTLVSANRLGTNGGDRNSFNPLLSADGRFVAFLSYASDLVDQDTNNAQDVFVRDLQTGKTTLISANLAGIDSGNNYSYFPEISADGRFVVFTSLASDLVSNDTNIYGDVFVHDLQTGTTTLASVNLAGTASGNGLSLFPSISADGRFVVFYSHATDLVANDTNKTSDVFVRDLQSGTTILVSVNREGTDSGNSTSEAPVISPDGRFVAFYSYASDLAGKDTNNALDIFVRDLQTGTTVLASANREGTDSGNGSTDVVLTDRPALSANGHFVAFGSNASDLVDRDTNKTNDVFVRDLQRGTTALVSANRSGEDSGNWTSYQPAISADGRFVAFGSRATDLVSNSTYGEWDVFVRDLLPNFPPSVDAGGPYAVDEGSSLTLTASGSDPEGTPLTYLWDLNNDELYETPGQSVVFSTAGLDGPTSRTVKVMAIDGDGLAAVDQTTVMVVNVPPTVVIGSDATIFQGQAYSGSGSFSDPGPDFWSATVDYGDGSGVHPLVLNGNSFLIHHVYNSAGSFTVTVTVIDDDGGIGSDTLLVSVLTPRQGMEGLIDDVGELVASGTINSGQGNSLVSKLETAIKQLERGNVRVAINLLEAFINEVNSTISSGVLTPAEGQPLIDQANAIIVALQ
jgi:hypothetical protein